MDSGSCADIMSAKCLPPFAIKDGSGENKTRRLVAANGSPIAYHGDKAVKFKTNDGIRCKWDFAAADVNKCLKSVSKTCDTGNGMWFNKTGGMIVDEVLARQVDKLLAEAERGRKMGFDRVGDAYKMEAWVRRPGGKVKQSRRPVELPGFSGQGM